MADTDFVFLMCAVVLADARPRSAAGASLNPDRQQRMEALLQRRHPDCSPAQRRGLIKQALSGLPRITGGLDFLAQIEAHSARLAAGMDASRAREAVEDLASIVGDGLVTSPDLRVFRAIIRFIGLEESTTASIESGRLVLR